MAVKLPTASTNVIISHERIQALADPHPLCWNTSRLKILCNMLFHDLDEKGVSNSAPKIVFGYSRNVNRGTYMGHSHRKGQFR
ncbi:unnamed protein product, partial [Nesidiocoris tenuis]